MESDQNAPKNFLSTQGYRGTRDFYPEDMRLKTFIHTKIYGVLQRFGYEEYDGPILEHLELYASKSSQEIVRDQLYSLTDRGERVLAIRPEMTPTLARMVAARQKQLPLPIRWFSIPTCMRFERPQRGRLREFGQLNVDVLGGLPLDEDIEILLSAVELLLSFEATHQDFVIRVNHRGIVNQFIKHVLHLSLDQVAPLLRLLDKRDKISQEEFQNQCTGQFSLSSAQIQKLDFFLKATIEETIEILKPHHESALELQERLDILNQLSAGSAVQFDASIMRGFDYYTGLVFEAYDTHPENRRALFGGGRYDNLVASFGCDPMSGVGYGFGVVPLQNFLEVHGLLPTLCKPMDAAVLRFAPQDRLISLLLAQELRRLGLHVEHTITQNKFGKQIQQAEKSGAKVIVFRGEDEIKSNSFCVKWLATGQQQNLPYGQEGFQTLHKLLKA